MTEKRFNARENTDNDDFEERLKVKLEEIIGIVHTDEPTDSVELKKEYYKNQSKDKELVEENEQLKYTLSAYMVDLNNCKGECSALEIENEQLKKELYLIDKLIEDLGHEEMKRQYEEICGDSDD